MSTLTHALKELDTAFDTLTTVVQAKQVLYNGHQQDLFAPANFIAANSDEKQGTPLAQQMPPAKVEALTGCLNAMIANIETLLKDEKHA